MDICSVGRNFEGRGELRFGEFYICGKQFICPEIFEFGVLLDGLGMSFWFHSVWENIDPDLAR